MENNPKCSVTAEAVRGLHQNKCCLAFTGEALTSLQGISPAAKAWIKIGRGETWDGVADPYPELNHSEDQNMDQRLF